MNTRSPVLPGAPARRLGLLLAAGALALATFQPGLARAAGSAPGAHQVPDPGGDGRGLGPFRGPREAARTVTEMYLAATELAASIRCGHTWTDLRVKRTFEAQAAGVDQELEAVRRLVGKQDR
jgi:hypothetical protein